jgi:signal transduction histidine kinase
VKPPSLRQPTDNQDTTSPRTDGLPLPTKKTTRARGASSLLGSLVPRTLRGRLVVTTVFVALAVTASTLAVGVAFTTRAVRIRTSAEAVESLAGFGDYMHLTADRAGSLAQSFAARSDVLRAVRSNDTTSLSTLLGLALPSEEERSVLLTGVDGRVLARSGTNAGLLASSTAFPDGARLVASGTASVPAVIVSRAIPPTGTPVATLVVASAIGTRTQDGFRKTADSRLMLAPAGTTERVGDWSALQVAGFLHPRYSSDGERTRVMATYLGVDGKPVVDIGVDHVEESLVLSESARWMSALAAVVFALIIGLALGVTVADRIRAPIDAMADRVKHEGDRVVEGLPYSGVSMDDDRLPAELRELGAVVDDLLYGLSARFAELQRSAAATQEAEEALAVTVNESPDATILVQDGVVRIANPATTSHFGVGPRALLGRTPREAFNGLGLSDAAGASVDWDRLVEIASVDPVRVRLSIAGRGERWLEVHVAQPLGTAKERVLLSARDVTDARRLEQLRDDLVSMVGHDLRSPLTVIVGYLDLLSTELPESIRSEAIASAKANADRLDAMLDDLLEAARAEQVFVPREFLPVDACDLAEDVAVSLRGSFPDHPVSVVCERSRSVLGEERRLRQALMNLAANAAKYSPSKTPVTIAIEGDADDVRFVVEDEGPGIPDDAKQAVFDRFTRIGTSSGRPGMGLGLYIVRTVAEGHSGRAFVEDRPGGGSRFVMQLPAVPEDPAGD